MAHLAKTDGLRLLRCINDTQVRGREGAKVDPPGPRRQPLGPLAHAGLLQQRGGSGPRGGAHLS